MFQLGPPPSAAPKRSKGKYDAITSFYHDEWKFSIVTSTTMFIFGICLARSMIDVEIGA